MKIVKNKKVSFQYTHAFMYNFERGGQRGKLPQNDENLKNKDF